MFQLMLLRLKGIPGTATVTLTDNITIEKNLFLVNFGTKSVSDEFNSSYTGKPVELGT